MATSTAARTLCSRRRKKRVRGSAECSDQHVLLPTRRWLAEQAATPRNYWSLAEDDLDRPHRGLTWLDAASHHASPPAVPSGVGVALKTGAPIGTAFVASTLGAAD